MSAFILLIILLFIRYGLPFIINRNALNRVGYFPPVQGREIIAFWVYLISNSLMLLSLLFLKIHFSSKYFFAGLISYILGTALYAISVIDYMKPRNNGINIDGFYKLSRNPIYVAYFIYMLGCTLLTSSLYMLILLLIFQTSVHWIILSEERWCIKRFGADYLSYMNRVRRYF